MVIPEEFARQGKSQKVCKLHKSPYALKHAHRQWNLKLTEALALMGFEQSHYDYSLFTKKATGDVVIVLVYMVSLLVTGNNPSLINDTRCKLQQRFKINDLGELKFFLGIEFVRSNKSIFMCQKKYALELVAEAGLGGAKPAGIPLELNQELTSVKYDECVKHKESSEDKQVEDPSSYQRLVRRLLYLTMTRHDIDFAVQVLSQCVHCPKVSHMESTLRVVRRIKEAPGLGLIMPTRDTEQLTAYCDSDWGACVETRRSVTGYLVKFGKSLVSWKSKK
ncbi:PREDICTED: uncharacterized protein LOC109237313 [Nicotiana attenuata]|uniref:uncharacterized protein LOC109237313 n=1 Tax=Nicotiana attenuata TaxID=49451 RepID=UPI000905A4F1|nr:PREDICTED: uncharacterized protein LOC109237313 [Nicotiana attenuata]